MGGFRQLNLILLVITIAVVTFGYITFSVNAPPLPPAAAKPLLTVDCVADNRVYCTSWALRFNPPKGE
jgi:hypothetical protein